MFEPMTYNPRRFEFLARSGFLALRPRPLLPAVRPNPPFERGLMMQGFYPCATFEVFIGAAYELDHTGK